MDSGREQNYWPGFVDALSNVVLTLVFVLVIFVFALVIASHKVEQRMQEITQAASASKTGQSSEQEENADLKKKLAAMTTELEKMRGKSSASTQQESGAVDQQAVTDQNQQKQIVVDDKDENTPNQGPVDITHTNNTVIVGFPLDIAEMDKKSEEQLGHVLEAMQQTVGKHKVIIHSFVGRETYSAARRLAYYRAVGARNYLITKLGANPSDITMSIIRPTEPEDGHVEIVFEKE